jgi:hypothetical protein
MSYVDVPVGHRQQASVLAVAFPRGKLGNGSPRCDFEAWLLYSSRPVSSTNDIDVAPGGQDGI